MKLTNNFTLSEFNKHNSPLTSEVQGNITRLAHNLQMLRDYLDAGIKVTSGYRSPEVNAKVGGAKKSTHLTGKAADIKVSGYTPKQVYNSIEALIEMGRMEQGGLGLYPTWVHYDIRGTKARW